MTIGLPAGFPLAIAACTPGHYGLSCDRQRDDLLLSHQDMCEIDREREEVRRVSRWSAVAIRRMARSLVRRDASDPITKYAVRTWEIAAQEMSITPKAFYLPGQLDRVTGWEFSSEHPRREMEGCGVVHAATRGFLLRDVWLLDGSLYKDDAFSWLAPRTRGSPPLRADLEIARGALFCTAMGNKYFGQWLMDDCATYSMAKDEGLPVTTDHPMNVHTLAYEDWLDMKPSRVNNVFFRELVVFEDFGQNRHKHRRFRELGKKLLSHINVAEAPGVFIVRGGTGQPRVLVNEMELAERLRSRRGFRVIDPASSSVPEIVTTCAGADVVIGVEGSGLIHGVLPLAAGGSILALQPPNRFVSVFKHLADRDGQNFGFVVGRPSDGGFCVDPDEVERTLDLFPRLAHGASNP